MADNETIDFECPKCGLGVDSGDIPDHVSDARQTPENTFEYECSCGCVFDVFVEYMPEFYVNDANLRTRTIP